ncbi:MAG: TetR family transcriptional regulator C-terminal domain-containing protein [Alphaproteobacteria bacterium]|nr:TetR family transcriptional regulator C-terminal domain-containing protein [Alphaproteobacteria bacterium]MDE2631196.1 TetR family transcriptional regulator C-terminal domain-containing protein [Alphaproteobacteria bacterium]
MIENKVNRQQLNNTANASASTGVCLHWVLVGNRGGAIALGMVRQTVCELVSGELMAPAGKNAKDAMPREFIVQYLVEVYITMMNWWLDDGAKLAPQQINLMFQHLTTEGIANHLRWFRRRHCGT